MIEVCDLVNDQGKLLFYVFGDSVCMCFYLYEIFSDEKFFVLGCLLVEMVLYKGCKLWILFMCDIEYILWLLYLVVK